MKRLKATKVREGWSVEISETHFVFSESDVYKLGRQNGLKQKTPIINNNYIYME